MSVSDKWKKKSLFFLSSISDHRLEPNLRCGINLSYLLTVFDLKGKLYSFKGNMICYLINILNVRRKVFYIVLYNKFMI